MKQAFKILLIAFCTFACSVDADRLRKAKTKFDSITDGFVTDLTAGGVGSIGTIGTIGTIGGSSSSSGYHGMHMHQDYCHHPGWGEYCAMVSNSKSGIYIRKLRQFQESHKGQSWHVGMSPNFTDGLRALLRCLPPTFLPHLP